MRLGSLILLTALSVPFAAYAEQTLPTPSVTQPTTSAQATVSNPAAVALNVQLQQQAVEQEALLQAARKENQRLKQQLDQALANSAPVPLLSEQQTWYLIGAGSALLGALIGAQLRGGRRTRREWLN